MQIDIFSQHSNFFHNFEKSIKNNMLAYQTRFAVYMKILLQIFYNIFKKLYRNWGWTTYSKIGIPCQKSQNI